jgi:hypothetical protein
MGFPVERRPAAWRFKDRSRFSQDLRCRVAAQMGTRCPNSQNVTEGVVMNARAMRRLFLPLAMTAAVGASVYAAAGTSIAASTPKLPGPAVVKSVRFEFGVKNKAGKIIKRETGVAKVMRVGAASAIGKQAGAATPDLGVSGPSTVCLIHQLASASVPAGGYGYIEFKFPSAPFVAGSMFNEQNVSAIAENILYSSGDDVFVDELNNGGGTATFDGYYGVLYWDGGC